jgi:hypothetical protein
VSRNFVLDLVQARIRSVEERYGSWGGPESSEIAMLTLCEWREALADPMRFAAGGGDGVRSAFVAFVESVAGEGYSGFLHDLLAEHDALDQHPKLLGDFARWLEVRRGEDAGRRADTREEYERR